MMKKYGSFFLVLWILLVVDTIDAQRRGGNRGVKDSSQNHRRVRRQVIFPGTRKISKPVKDVIRPAGRLPQTDQAWDTVPDLPDAGGAESIPDVGPDEKLSPFGSEEWSVDPNDQPDAGGANIVNIGHTEKIFDHEEKAIEWGD